MDDKIDFIITWVDGSDDEWLVEKKKYLKLEPSMYYKDANISRYRDWGTLKYWFRGVEKYAPWVNNIYFVTWGHIPKWLDTSNPKLKIIRHEDFVPKEYLPTFNINTIENNFHRINGLSEHFVYFNDDMFLIKEVNPTDFFSKKTDNYPMDSAILTAHCYSRKETLVMTPIVDIGIINAHFNLKDVISRDYKKWFTFKYGRGLIQNLILSQCPRFPGVEQHHLPTALLKSTYNEVWACESEQLDLTCRNKFRSIIDVNQWLYREWQLASGKFEPRNKKIGKSFVLTKGKEDVYDYIRKTKGKMICINDAEMSEKDFVVLRDKLIHTFDDAFPDKCSYERD